MMAGQTEAARADLRFARKYLDNNDFNSARRYVASARQKDPNVTLDIKTGPQSVGLLTPNSLEAEILAIQASHYQEQLLKLMHDENKRIDSFTEDELIASIDHRLETGRQIDESAVAEFASQRDYLVDERIKCLEASVRLEPNIPAIQASLGRAYLEKQNYTAAVQLLTAAQRKWPEDFEIHRTLDSALTEQKAVNSLKTAPTVYYRKTSGTRFLIVAVAVILVFLWFAVR
jgi:predicted Zn-dependent protease